MDKELHNDYIYDFAFRIANAIYDLKSSHVYFVVQKAFGEIAWEEVEGLLIKIINHCDCNKCKKVKLEIINNLKG